jgi:hypothetical protein
VIRLFKHFSKDFNINLKSHSNMDRLEFELETRDAAEQFRAELEARVHPMISEKFTYFNKKERIGYSHLAIVKKGHTSGIFTYELDAKRGIYICTLDLRRLPEITIDVPGRIVPTTAFEFAPKEQQFFLHSGEQGVDKKFEQKGFTLYPTMGQHYPVVCFTYQAIAKDGELLVRYAHECFDADVCSLDIRMSQEDYEKIRDLLAHWTREFFSQKFSEQKTQHHTSPQSACEPAKQT